MPVSNARQAAEARLRSLERRIDTARTKLRALEMERQQVQRRLKQPLTQREIAADIARRVRSGQSLEDIAKAFDLMLSTVQQYLSEAGGRSSMRDEAVLAAYESGQSVREIAASLDVSNQMVYVRLNRARARRSGTAQTRKRTTRSRQPVTPDGQPDARDVEMLARFEMGHSHKAIAAEFGITPMMVAHRLALARIYRDGLPSEKAASLMPLLEEYEGGMSTTELAYRERVSVGTIHYRIKHARAYRAWLATQSDTDDTPHG